MLISESILRELYPKDLGLDSPNPANHYQLEKHRLGAFHSLGLGYPYKWAQRMAGLYFDAPDVQEQRANVRRKNQLILNITINFNYRKNYYYYHYLKISFLI